MTAWRMPELPIGVVRPVVTVPVLSSTTVSLLSPPSPMPDSIRHFEASTSAIELPASTAKCFAALANGTLRARPESVPSASKDVSRTSPAPLS